MASADTEARLQAYRQRVQQDPEVQWLNLRGLPEPVGRDGRRFALQMPLDRLYIRLQAIQETQARRAEEEEERRLSAEALAHEADRSSARPVLLSVLRTLGEHFYHKGETYAADQRPDPVDPEAALREHERLVILGAPGAGKSTLLRYLARRAAQDADGPIPLLAPLGEYAARLSLGHDLNLQDFAIERAAGKNEALRAALAEAAAQQRILWLVDALDEAYKFRGRAAREAAHLPGQLVLTSRPVGYERPPALADLPHYEILPLEVEAVRDFLRRWFTVLAERRGEGEDWVERRVAWLEEQLQQQPHLQPLSRNPLMLTFLVLLAGEEPARRLPATRAGLYEAYLRELLLTWEARRRGGAGQGELELGSLRGEAARQAALAGVHRLGWRLHWLYYSGQDASFPTRDELVDFLSKALPQAQGLPKAERPNLAAAVVDFWEQAGLFIYWHFEGETFLTFRHLTFQEYGAAKVLADLWEGGKETRKRAWAFLKPRLHHPAWREVLLLLGTVLADATDLVRRVRSARSPYEWELLRDHALAAALVGEGARVAEKEIHRLVRALRRPLARWRWVAFLVGYALPFIVLFLGGLIGGLIWPWRHWPWWGAIGGDLLWLLGWGLGIKYLSKPALDALERLFERLTEIPRFQAWYGLLWRRLALPCTAWQIQAVKTLTPLHSAAIPALIQALSDENWEVRRAAAEVLGKIGPPTIPALTQALEDGEWWVREAAAEALVKIGTPAIPALTQALGDADKYVRWVAAEALGRIGDPQAIPALTQALRDKAWEVRWAAAEALGRIGDPQAIPALTQALRDENPWEREAAAEALGAISDPQAIPNLSHNLKDEDDVHRVVAHALGAIGVPQPILALHYALEDEDAGIMCEAAALTLGCTGDAQSIPDFHQALRDEDVDARWAAAEALGRIGDAQAIPALTQALRDKAWEVRWAAAEALGRIGDAQAIPALTQALRDEAWGVCRAAAEALGRIGDVQAIPALTQALGDADEDVREAAAEALGKLAEGLRDPSRARQVARALWWRLTDLHEGACNAAYHALQAVAARWAELAVNALPRHDPLQPQAMTRWQRALQWGVYGLAALLFLTAGSLFLLVVEPIKDAVSERLLPWLQEWPTLRLVALAVGLGLAGSGLFALGKWLWGRVQAKTS